MADEEQKCPLHLYHHSKIDKEHPEYTEAIFTKNQIYFGSPSNYNDPFDTKILYSIEASPIKLESWLRKKQKQYSDKISKEDIKAVIRDFDKRQEFIDKYNAAWDRDLKTLGTFCLSEIRNNILMWAHYSDCHQGFCLEFSTNNSFFGESRPITYPKQKLLPKHNIIEKSFDLNMFLIKAVDWEYEEEWRLFQTIGPGKYNFPSKALTGVIFGCRIAPEDKTKIINWCHQRNPRPQLYNAVPKETEYGLDIIPFDYPT